MILFIIGNLTQSSGKDIDTYSSPHSPDIPSENNLQIAQKFDGGSFDELGARKILTSKV